MPRALWARAGPGVHRRRQGQDHSCARAGAACGGPRLQGQDDTVHERYQLHRGGEAARRLAPDFEIFQFGRDCKYADKMRLGEAVCDGCGQCFVTLGNPEPRDMRYARQAYDLAVRTLDEAQADLVILDEISNALYYGLLDAEDVANLIERRPPGVELVLTGRNMPPAILDMADLVTEMKMVKHPFESGIPARRGIEY